MGDLKFEAAIYVPEETQVTVHCLENGPIVLERDSRHLLASHLRALADSVQCGMHANVLSLNVDREYAKNIQNMPISEIAVKISLELGRHRLSTD